MNIGYEQVMGDLAHLLTRLSDDVGYLGPISEETYLLSDLGFESLGLVVLGVSIQEYYKRNLPFAELFADLGEREIRDISVGDLVRFVHLHLEHPVAGDMR